MKLQGISGARGVGAGTVYVYTQEAICIDRTPIEEAAVAGELHKLDDAMQMTIDQLTEVKAKAAATMGDAEAAIFEAHIMIAQDPSLLTSIRQAVESEHKSAAEATEGVIESFAAMFSAMDDLYMRERGADIRDIGDRLLRNLLGMTPRGLAHLSGQIILVADDLTPSDTASLDATVVQGIVTASGGPTSHAAIMARTLAIPAVMGVGDSSALRTGEQAVVNGTDGIVLTELSDDEFARYQEEGARYRRVLQTMKESANLPAKTKDGHDVLLFGNIGKADDAAKVRELGAEGIGLFRTEFLYMERDELPNEEVQYEAYKACAEAMDGRPVIIRTMDIGGDKELKCLALPKEMNPFLGYRAIRICLSEPDMFKTQLKALLRAGVHGQVHIMYPMISSLDEVRRANALLQEAKDELAAAGVAFNGDTPVGIMVETPAAAMIADILAKEVDFFSIGTNDLCQYTLAVDRMNERIGQLYEPLHPAVLRLIKQVIDASHKEGKLTGMCGEMAGDPMATMILLGLGLDEFSMSATAIPMIKAVLRSVTVDECRHMAVKALTLGSAKEIAAYVTRIMTEKGIEL